MINFSDPAENIKKIGIGEGSVVVDLGSGTGFYSIEAARVVGSEGRVYSVDIQKDLLERLRHVAHDQGLQHVEIIWGNIEKIGGSRIGNEVADLTLVCNTLFQIEDMDSFLTEVLRVTRTNGRVCIIEWSGTHFGIGPAEDLIVSDEKARALFEKHFEFVKDFDAGQYHYGLIFRKK